MGTDSLHTGHKVMQIATALLNLRDLGNRNTYNRDEVALDFIYSIDHTASGFYKLVVLGVPSTDDCPHPLNLRWFC